MKYLTLTFPQDRTNILLEGLEYHHVIRLLRYQIGDTLILRNRDSGLLYQSIIIEVSKRTALLQIVDFFKVSYNQPIKKLSIELWLPWLKKSSLERCLRQSCEVGVRAIRLIKTDYSVSEKLHFIERDCRYKKILEQAGEQSGNLRLPTIEYSDSLEEALLSKGGNLLFYAHHESNHTNFFLSDIYHKTPFTSCLLLIGPEGGLSKEEISLLESHKNCYQVYFDTYTLKADTASLYFLSYLENAYRELVHVR